MNMVTFVLVFCFKLLTLIICIFPIVSSVDGEPYLAPYGEVVEVLVCSL